MNKTYREEDENLYSSDTPRNHRIHPRSQFSPEEDHLLMNLVAKYGLDKWEDISNDMKNRNVRQCKDRWMNYLSPSVKKSPWTPEEDDLLEKLYLKYGPKWVKIAQLIEGRTDINLKNRYLLLQRHKKRKEKLLEKIDEKDDPVKKKSSISKKSKLSVLESQHNNNKCISSFMDNFFDIQFDFVNKWDLFEFD